MDLKQITSNFERVKEMVQPSKEIKTKKQQAISEMLQDD